MIHVQRWSSVVLKATSPLRNANASVNYAFLHGAVSPHQSLMFSFSQASISLQISCLFVRLSSLQSANFNSFHRSYSLYSFMAPNLRFLPQPNFLRSTSFTVSIKLYHKFYKSKVHTFMKSFNLARPILQLLPAWTRLSDCPHGLSPSLNFRLLQIYWPYSTTSSFPGIFNYIWPILHYSCHLTVLDLFVPLSILPCGPPPGTVAVALKSNSTKSTLLPKESISSHSRSSSLLPNSNNLAPVAWRIVTLPLNSAAYNRLQIIEQRGKSYPETGISDSFGIPADT